MVFIGRVLLGFQISPSTFPFLLFSSFFVNFDFSYFFVFLKASNINVNSTRKISGHKSYALKVKRVPNTFENLNSFEMTLKMLKMMQIYQKCIFLDFHCFFAIFGFFLKIYQNMGQKFGSNTCGKNRWVNRWEELMGQPEGRTDATVILSCKFNREGRK